MNYRIFVTGNHTFPANMKVSFPNPLGLIIIKLAGFS